MKTANPLLVSISEAGFQLDIPVEEVKTLIQSGELVAIQVRGHVLVRYDSLVALTRRSGQVREFGSESPHKRRSNRREFTVVDRAARL